jgi:UDP-glucose:(heptosyl)LPS alpha-1,3-glucosyltransferase
VVTSTKSGAAELVREHDAGLVCPARDVAGLASHMHLLLDAGQRARLGANAREAVLPLTPAAMTLGLVLLYKDLLTGIAERRKSRRRRAREAAAPDPADTPAPPPA